jgi:hypothetical protein
VGNTVHDGLAARHAARRASAQAGRRHGARPMIRGTIARLEPKLAWVDVDGEEEPMLFFPHWRSVTHGARFEVGDRVSIRLSRDNSRIASIVHLDPDVDARRGRQP